MANSRLLLLDTSILLAALINPKTLPAATRQQLEATSNSVLFSAASIWEIAIKSSLKRDDFDFQSTDIQRLAEQTGFDELPILSNHCHGVADLPWHHRDPFDRLLIAQAQSVNADFLTRDSTLAVYSDLVKIVG
ncbi:MAG: PIN domain nuclease [Halochromatium sp.]|nr:PIN domain nuclease [Halochromatium sp.]